MAKISTTKLFELGQISDEKLREQLPPLVSYINELSDNTIRALQKKLNFADNFDAEEVTLEFQHNEPKEFQVREPYRVKGVIPIRILHSSDIAVGNRWEVATGGNIKAKFLFQEGGTDKRRVNFLVIYG